MSEKEKFLAITTNPDGSTEGKNPSLLSRKDFEALGHVGLPPLKAIRACCVDCSGDSYAEARRCTAYTCHLWPYRMGRNPFRKPKTVTEVQLSALARGKIRLLDTKGRIPAWQK